MGMPPQKTIKSTHGEDVKRALLMRGDKETVC